MTFKDWLGQIQDHETVYTNPFDNLFARYIIATTDNVTPASGGSFWMDDACEVHGFEENLAYHIAMSNTAGELKRRLAS